MSIIDSFYLQNVWRKQKHLEIGEFIEREVLPEIRSWLDEEDILVLIGPRQSGKTYFKKVDIRAHR